METTWSSKLPAESLTLVAGKYSVKTIENEFFGQSVTVTGLLTGRDIIKSVHNNEGAA